MTPRLGAYLLTGDPVWLRSSLNRYYGLLDDLVVLVPDDGLGWTGRPLPINECIAAVSDIDVRGIARTVTGRWRNDANPMLADTAQRQAGIDAVSDSVDWIIQIDNDELLPDPEALLAALQRAGDARGVEWPMRVLYRRTGDRFLGVSGRDGLPVFEYPGPVAVRAGSVLVDARRMSGSVVRMTVVGDNRSAQLRQPVAGGEIRVEALTESQVIMHNSWAKSPAEVWRKTRSWGHASGLRGALYYVVWWLPAPITWRWMRNFHPFARGLWPRLTVVAAPSTLVGPDDVVTRNAWRSRVRR